jgi:zinc protease
MTLSFPSPETITRVELPNGIVVLVYENPTSPAVVVSGAVWAGAMSEAAEQAGLSSFTAGMLMRGTERRTFAQINEALEAVGAQLGFRSGVHTATFGSKALAEDLDLLLDILADCLQRPIFPPEEVETLRGQILTGIQRRAHDTGSMAELTFDALLYPGHPYGRSVQGYEETVPGLSRDDLAAYYRAHYAPEGMMVVVVGAVPAEAVLDRVQAALGGWQAPGARRAPRPTAAFPRRWSCASSAARRWSSRARPSRTWCWAGRAWPATTRISCGRAWPTPCWASLA